MLQSAIPCEINLLVKELTLTDFMLSFIALSRSQVQSSEKGRAQQQDRASFGPSARRMVLDLTQTTLSWMDHVALKQDKRPHQSCVRAACMHLMHGTI